MSKDTLQKQADRADNIADQTVDGDMKKILRDAAKEYRDDVKQEPKQESRFALFRGNTQLAGSFSSEQEVMRAALAEGLIPELQTADESGAQVLPADYHIERLEQPYDPQPDWKLPREIS